MNSGPNPMRRAGGDGPHATLLCGATTRSGAPCRQAPIRGAARCRMHGGAAPQAAGVDSGALKGEPKSEPATEGTLMSEPVWCTRGCYAWGRHLPDCEQRDNHSPGCVDDSCPGCNPEQCPGCQPQEAVEGALCAHCCQVLGALLAGPDEHTDGKDERDRINVQMLTHWATITPALRAWERPPAA